MDWAPESSDLNPIQKCWDVLETDLHSCQTLQLSIIGETLMQHWMEINLVRLQKLIRAMTQIMHAVIRACDLFFFLGGNFFSLAVYLATSNKREVWCSQTC